MNDYYSPQRIAIDEMIVSPVRDIKMKHPSSKRSIYTVSFSKCMWYIYIYKVQNIHVLVFKECLTMGVNRPKKDQNIIYINIFVFFGRFIPIVRHSLNTSTCIFSTFQDMRFYIGLSGFILVYQVLYWFIRMNLDISRK
jgi:hypothetical protein